MKKQFQNQHPRLSAFFDSSVLNGLIIMYALGWFLLGLSSEIAIPFVIFFAMVLIGIIAYSLWFWIKRPKEVLVNKHLSDITGLMVLYLLIVSAIKEAGIWWYIFGIISTLCSFLVLFKKGNNKAEHTE